MLVILAIIYGRVSADIIPVFGIIGGEIVFPLEIQNLSDPLGIEVKDAKNCSCKMNVSRDCCNDCERQMCLKKNGFLEIKHLSKTDKGEYTVFLETTGKRTFNLSVCEIPTAHIHCQPDGSAELTCEVDSLSSDGVYWTLNGKHMNETDACVKDGGKMIVLGKGISGNLTCHRKNTCGEFSIVVSCDDEDEKDEGVTLSAISSEGPKSPPNGDHCEPTDALVASTPNPGPESCQSFRSESKTDPSPAVEPQVEPGPNAEAEAGTEFREVMVDSEPLEDVDDCFPDPVDG
ncbi:hypothetical protein lerEdw1_011342 [Lerista edwardsae]|nr:hypothetical protein lerEdw1_011342 [Lerista edwardsae]